MPTYEYACKACGEHLEVVQSFKDDPLTTCPACGGPLRKVFGSIGIAFKGNGFYRTDNRPAAPKREKREAASADGSSGGKEAAAAGGGAADKGSDKAGGTTPTKGDATAKTATAKTATAKTATA
jgi:putative FmdB family regulatory protein